MSSFRTFQNDDERQFCGFKKPSALLFCFVSVDLLYLSCETVDSHVDPRASWDGLEPLAT